MNLTHKGEMAQHRAIMQLRKSRQGAPSEARLRRWYNPDVHLICPPCVVGI